MKDKVLFANAGVAKFMALLVTLLTMFASCNFVGGQDARTVVKGINPPPKYERPGEGGATTLRGVFKNPIPGQIDVGIWDGSFTCTNLPELIARSGSWWGGAFGWVETVPEWSMPRKYDVSGIVKCSFDVTAFTDVPDAWVVIFPKVDDGDTEKENNWEDEAPRKVDVKLSAGETKQCELSFDAAYGKSTNRARLVGFGGGAGGGTLSITNVTFYDANGNEVVPKIVETN